MQKTPPFPTETPDWQDSAFLICEKCGKKLGGAENPAVELKDYLKDELKEKGVWGKTRVMMSGCMDICPSGKVTVGVVASGAKPQCLVLDPEEDREKLLDYIVANAPK